MLSLFRRQPLRTKNRARPQFTAPRNRLGRTHFSTRFEPLEVRALLSATVGTDLDDYAPGDTAYISGTGWDAGETISLQVLHEDGTTGGAGHEPWLVTDGGDGDLDGVADGNFLTSWYVDPDDSLGSTFVLTASGLSSGESASATFTDAGNGSPTNIAAANGWLTDNTGNDPTVVNCGPGFVIAAVAIKSGTSTFALAGTGGDANIHTNADDPGTSQHSQVITADGTYGTGGNLYSVTGIGTSTVTVDRISGKAISHVDYKCAKSSEPETFSISGRKFEDLDGDGTDDGGTDPGLLGWTIFIDVNGNGSNDDGFSTVTAADGTYSIGGLPAGSYTVLEVGQAGWTNTLSPAGPVTVGPNATGVDFGNFENYCITVHKFVDINGDGGENGGDGGVAGISISIWVDSDGDSVVDDGETQAGTTDENGNFEVCNIGPGAVVVTEDLSQSAFEWANVSSSNTSFTGTSGQDQSTTFGNILCNAGVAKTLGFWANNADKKFSDILALNGALDTGGITNVLYNSASYTSGVNEFLTFKAFRTWILGASAKNMEYMLSAQLAAAALNVGSGMASAYTLVTMTDAQVASLGLTTNDYTVVDGQNVIQIKDVIALANAALLSGGSKDYLGALKTILDNFNNMTNWYDSSLC